MKAKFEFTLPEEKEEYEIYYNAPNYHCVLVNFAAYLRNKYKYEEVELHDTCSEYGVEI